MNCLTIFFKRIHYRLFGAFKLSSLLSKEIHNEWIVLDVGCGRNSSLKKVGKWSYRVGLDIYKPYILQVRKLSIHNDYVLADARTLPFKSNSFDCVVATEILEHLSKHDGLKMLKEIERIARKKILMTTPNGFLPTYAGPEDNPKESHLCGYNTDELRKFGFKVWGLNGLKALWTIKSGRATVKSGLHRTLSILFNDVAELFTYHFPYLAFQFFLIKDLRNNDEQ